MTDPLDRIAAALDRIAPPGEAAADPLAHPAYVWRGDRLNAVHTFTPLPLDLLCGIDGQKEALLANFQRHASGAAAHDVLLWGARGTGKSALVKSAVETVQAAGGRLTLVEVATHQLETLAALFAVLAPLACRYAVFIDDLGFDAASDARALRSMLEGGAEARPPNVRLAVTSNRRHLVPRDVSEQEGAINPRDVVDDSLALADRFGLSLGFHVVDQNGYLTIVEGYVKAYGLPFDPADALLWATQRGSRSGRVAWHYVIDLAGRQGRALEHP